MNIGSTTDPHHEDIGARSPRPKEWRDKQSAGVKAAHRRGVYVKVGEERRRKTMEKREKCGCGCGLPIARAGGKYASQECARKKAAGASPQHMETMRSKRNMDKLKAENSIRMKNQVEQWKADGTRNDYQSKAMKVLRGSSGFGSGKRGRLDHHSAKAWHIRDVNGKTHRFTNLFEWVRKNEHLFHDDRPNSKLPFATRIACGISNLGNQNGKTCSYRGWAMVSPQEYIIDDGADPLERDSISEDNAPSAAPDQPNRPSPTDH